MLSWTAPAAPPPAQGTPAAAAAVVAENGSGWQQAECLVTGEMQRMRMQPGCQGQSPQSPQQMLPTAVQTAWALYWPRDAAAARAHTTHHCLECRLLLLSSQLPGLPFLLLPPAPRLLLLRRCCSCRHCPVALLLFSALHLSKSDCAGTASVAATAAYAAAAACAWEAPGLRAAPDSLCCRLAVLPADRRELGGCSCCRRRRRLLCCLLAFPCRLWPLEHRQWRWWLLDWLDKLSSCSITKQCSGADVMAGAQALQTRSPACVVAAPAPAAAAVAAGGVCSRRHPLAPPACLLPHTLCDAGAGAC